MFAVEQYRRCKEAILLSRKRDKDRDAREGGREGWMGGWIDAKDLLYICACIRGINLMMPAQEKRERKSTSVSI